MRATSLVPLLHRVVLLATDMAGLPVCISVAATAISVLLATMTGACDRVLAVRLVLIRLRLRPVHTLTGMSVSTTHCLIGAMSGVALVEGADKINRGAL